MINSTNVILDFSCQTRLFLIKRFNVERLKLMAQEALEYFIYIYIHTHICTNKFNVGQNLVKHIS
jgi:hypothetical protein